MFRKKILVPLGLIGRDLKSVHYALSLAERVQSHVYILRQVPLSTAKTQFSDWLDEALSDLVNSARQAGLTVSHHITHREISEEIIDLVREEGIDLLIFGTDDEFISDRLLHQIKPFIPTQIIQVKEKNHISYL